MTKFPKNMTDLQGILDPIKTGLEGLTSNFKERFGDERPVIGIDIGARSIKIVKVEDLDGTLTVTKSAIVPVGGMIGNDQEVLASLETAIVGFDQDDAYVVSLVNCPQTCTRRIIAPQMPKKELEAAIKWEAKNAIPFSLEEAIFGYDIVGDAVIKEAKKMVVIVAATPKETTRRYLNLFSKAGIEISSMVPMSLCYRNLPFLSDKGKGKNFAVVEIGAQITELNIYHDGQLAFSRKLPIAGNDITNSLTSALMTSEGKVELSLEEAEKIKVEQGIPIVSDDTPVDGKILPSQILSLVRPCVEQLATELERSFDFYREESHGKGIDQVILLGGGANLKGLTKALYDDLGIETIVGNALERVPVMDEWEEPDSGSRLGLAVGAALTRGEKINLAPAYIREKTKRFVEHVSIQAVLVGLGTVMLLIFIGLKIQLGVQHNKLETLRLEQRTLIPQLEDLRSRIIAGQIYKDQPYWEDVLREISNTVQPKMYLTRIAMKDAKVHISGMITHGEQDAQGILSNFMIMMEEGIFRYVNLVATQKSAVGNTDLNFEITAELD